MTTKTFGRKEQIELEFDEKNSEDIIEENFEDALEGDDLEENIFQGNAPDEELENIKSELEKCKDRLLRTTAEYDNFRKRTEKEKLKIYSHATANAVLNILPVADSLELAQKSLEGSTEEYKKGLSMVKAQLNEALKKLGVEAFGKVGDDFNPDLHNAVSHVNDEKNEKENVISEVFQKGYKLNDKVVRHAMVQVAN